MDSKFTNLLFNALYCGVMIIDAETNIVVQINDAASKILNIDKSIIGSPCNRILCNGMEECEFKQQKQKQFPEEICFMTKVQKQKWILRHATKIIYNNKEYIVECFSDITNQKLLEKNYIDLVHYAPTGIYELDIKTYQHTHVNQVMLDYTGYTEEEFKDVGIIGLLTEPSKQLFVERMLRLKNGEDIPTEVEYEIVNKNGKHYWVLLNVRYIYNGDKVPHTAFCVVTNITERKCMELKLIAEKERAQMYLDMSFDIYVALDINGNIMLINKTGCDILGTTEEQLIGLNWFDTFVPDDDKQASIEEFRETIKGTNGENIRTWDNFIITLKGEKRFIRWKNRPIKDSHGNSIIGTFSSGDDITSEYVTEKKLLKLWNETEQEIKQSSTPQSFRRRSKADRYNQLDKAIQLVSNGGK